MKYGGMVRKIEKVPCLLGIGESQLHKKSDRLTTLNGSARLKMRNHNLKVKEAKYIYERIYL